MLYRCSVCGLYFEGEHDKCPKCGAPKENLIEVTGEDKEKIYKSERTNDIHAEIATLAMKIFTLAKEGEQINLDPPCVSLFKQAKDEAYIIKQRSKAEIASHVTKVKW